MEKPYIDPDRKQLLEARRRIARFMSAAFLILGRRVARQAVRWLHEMRKAEPSLEDLLAALDIEFDEDLGDDLVDELGRIYSSSGKLAMAQVGVSAADELVNQVNEGAISWAERHVGQLIGITPGENFIADATRNMIRTTIVDGMRNNLSTEMIAEQIEASYAFSEDRAELIAMTEVASANSMGALEGYQTAKENGVKVGKSWLILETACEVCHANADQGVIQLEQEFQSGDMAPPAHPNCRCVIVPESGFEKTQWNEADHPRDPGGEDGGQFVPKQSMSEDQIGALEDYMVSTFVGINEGSRDGTLSGDLARDAEILDAIATDTLTDDRVLYRRSIHSLSAIKDTQGRPLNSRFVGNIEIAGFTSTSFQRDVVDDFGTAALGGKTDILWEIEAPKGTRGIDVSARLSANRRDDLMGSQAEFILPRNTRLHVLSINRNGDNEFRIRARVAAQPMSKADWDESKHPRHPAGTEDGGEFRPKEGAAEAALRQHAEGFGLLAEKMGINGPGSPGHFERWLLREGEECGPVVPLPKGVRMGPQKMCYMNSYKALLYRAVDDAEWVYTEGVVAIEGLPITIEHAWLTNRKGEVLDLTLRGMRNVNYYGVPYDYDFVSNRVLNTGHYGLHSNGVHRYPDLVGGKLKKERAWPKGKR